MKFKKLMLVTFLLLAILSIGAVSASEDADNIAAADTQDLAVLSADDVDIIVSDDEEPEVDIASSIYYEDEGDPIVQYFFPEDATGDISIYIDNSSEPSYSSEVTTGKWVDIYGDDLEGFEFVPGFYAINVVYPGNDNYGQYSWESNLEITDEADEPVNTDYNITFGEYHYFNQEVVKGSGTYDASFEFPLSAEGNVTVYVDDEYYCVKDVDVGDVFIEISTANLTLGKHDVRFVYSGDGRFKSSTAYDSFNVTHIRFEVPYVLMPNSMGVSAYAGLTVLPFDATGEVKLIVDDVEKASEAIDEGSVIYYLPNYLTYGNHTVTLSYQNGNYPSASKKFSVENLINNDAVVSFNSTGAEGAMANVIVVKNTTFTLPECGFTKERRVFYGWNVGDAIRNPGENITVTGDIAIKTVWRYYDTDYENATSGNVKVNNFAVDLSTTSVVGTLLLTDKLTGELTVKNVTVGPVNSNYADANYNNITEAMIDEAVSQLLALAQTQAGSKTVTVKSQTVSDALSTVLSDTRQVSYLYYYEGADGLMESVRIGEMTGSYGVNWTYPLSLEAEYGQNLIDISDVTLTLSKEAFTYNAKVQKPTVTLTNGTVLKEGVDYTLGWSADSPKNVGTYTVTVTGIGAYNGTAQATFKINKAANPLAVKAKTVKVKFSAVKKKAQTLAVSKVVTFSKKGQGTLTYVKASGSKKITINKKTGKVTVAKGLKKGTYKVKIKIKAAGNANYKASAYKTVTFKVVIK